MKLRSLVLAIAALFATAAVPAPAGNGVSCGLANSTDTAFQRIDRTPSAGAAKICAIYLNTVDLALLR